MSPAARAGFEERPEEMLVHLGRWREGVGEVLEDGAGEASEDGAGEASSRNGGWEQPWRLFPGHGEMGRWDSTPEPAGRSRWHRRR